MPIQARRKKPKQNNNPKAESKNVSALENFTKGGQHSQLLQTLQKRVSPYESLLDIR